MAHAMTIPPNRPLRLLEQITRVSMEGTRGDVRIFSGGRLVYASYDGGRTQVVNATCAAGSDLLKVLKGVFGRARIDA